MIRKKIRTPTLATSIHIVMEVAHREFGPEKEKVASRLKIKK